MNTKVTVIRTLCLIIGIILSVLWLDLKWWQAWILFCSFGISFTLHLKKDNNDK